MIKNPYQSPAQVGTEPSTDPEILASAGEKVGVTVISGIWLKTHPLPFYSRYIGIGTIAEFLLVAFCVIYRTIVSRPKTETEKILNYSGDLYCVRTATTLFFIAAFETHKSRRLASVLASYKISSLLGCHFSDDLTILNFTFRSDISLTLHFIGDTNGLLNFVSSLEKQRGAAH